MKMKKKKEKENTWKDSENGEENLHDVPLAPPVSHPQLAQARSGSRRPFCGTRAGPRSNRRGCAEAQACRGPMLKARLVSAAASVFFPRRHRSLKFGKLCWKESHIFHYPHRLLRLPHKIILLLLNLCPGLFTDHLLVRVHTPPASS